jgi:enhancer of polycomb-like protein
MFSLWSRPFKGLTPFTFRFLRHAMTPHTESDHIHLVTDPTLYVLGPEGQPQGIVPYRLGVPPIIMRRDVQSVVRPFQPGMQLLPQQVHILTMQNGTPVSMQQLKKMQLPTAAQQMRISSGGGMRPPTVPVSNLQPALQQSQPVQLQAGALLARTPTPSRSTPVPVPQHSPPNGIGRPGITVPHVEVAKTEAVVTLPLANGVPTSPVPSDANVEVNNVPVWPKSQNITLQQRLNSGV